MRVLAADIGGTKTALALYEGERDALRETRSARYPSPDYPALEPILRDFLGGEPVDAAGLGVAGPVVSGRCQTTNLPWVVERDTVGALCGGAAVSLLNDLQAAALAIEDVPAAQRLTLQAGTPDPAAPSALVGVGTGLGLALRVPGPRGVPPLATEGGHADFAPRDDVEIGLLRAVRERHRRVSVERVVSGTGLYAIYGYVVQAGLATPDPSTAAALRAATDKSALVGERGLTRACAACAEALDLFVRLLGAECGNIALRVLPRGGLFLMGGVALKLRKRLQEPMFLAAFHDKGRMRELMESIPITLLESPALGLLGARNAALAALEASPGH